ncbi:hypothetical protein HY407_01135 [Candidatus Gottesmanbacteria bacterium]|nr:hypothetical protein [Candidatus Gottesmanbacteria bacterium]
MKRVPLKRLIRTYSRKIRFEKRERFAVVTLLLSLGLILTQIIWTDFRFSAAIVITILTYPLCVWAIKEDIGGSEWLTLFILPVLFTLSVALFYFLLPVRWLTRVPTVIFYAVGMYAILLSENIYNVAANRSIQLLRAAQSVGFLITLVILFLFVNIIFSFHLPIWQNFIVLSIIATFLYLQLFWAVLLEERISKRLLSLCLFLGFGIGELAYAFSYWPIRSTILALFISAVFYSIGGIVQEHLLEKLFKGVVGEYMWVTGAVFVLVLLATQWQ